MSREDVLELEAARVDAPRGERPEHERVVGIGAVAEADQHERRRLARGRQTDPGQPAIRSRHAEDGPQRLRSRTTCKQIYKLGEDGRARDGHRAVAGRSARLTRVGERDGQEARRARAPRARRPTAALASRPRASRIALEVIRHHRLLELLSRRDARPRRRRRPRRGRPARARPLGGARGAHRPRRSAIPTHDPHGDPIPDAEPRVADATRPEVTEAGSAAGRRTSARAA